MKSINDYFVQTKKMKFIVVNISAGVVMCFLLQPHINAEPETIPSQPVNVTVLRATSTTIELSWSEPEHPNGKILGYHLYFIHANTTDVKTVNASGKSEIEYVLSDLKPFTDYTIQLRAFTRNFVGNNSNEVRQKTDVAGPNAPQIVNITCQSHDSLFIQWQRPLEFYNTIDFYYVSYRNENVWDFEEIVIETSKEHLEVMKLLPNLSTNTMYEVKVHGATRSIFNKTVLMHGNASEPRKVMMRENCDKIQIFLQSSANELTAGMIAGFVCILFIILLVVIAFVLWRFWRSAIYKDFKRKIRPVIKGGKSSKFEKRSSWEVHLHFSRRNYRQKRKVCVCCTDTQKTFVAGVHFLEQANATHCARAVLDSMKDYDVHYDSVVGFVSDSARYMTKCSISLQVVLGDQMLHIQCWAHKLNFVGGICPKVLTELNSAISKIKSAFLNTRKRKYLYSKFLMEKYPNGEKNVTQFPLPILTRWNSWFQSVIYSSEYITDMIEFFTAENILDLPNAGIEYFNSLSQVDTKKNYSAS